MPRVKKYSHYMPAGTVLCKSNANDNRRISRYIGDI